MLFNSIEYIFIFVPFVIIIYFLFNKNKLIILAKSWLIFSSLIFYGWLQPKYILILLFSIFFNFSIGRTLNENYKINKKFVLFFGIFVNLGILAYFKYMDFFISELNTFCHLNIDLLKIALPIGISFYTFQQISYLSDSYQGKTKEYDFLNYTLFVVFFPQLVAGPIVRHQEVIPQFQNLKNKFINWKNISIGLFLFTIGLFKKVVIADTLAIYANLGFSIDSGLSFLEAWLSILSYTFQIYYDFSGYTDMALGIALMFNIKLPKNFNNPYFAIDIQDFWRRWHMTLSLFLKDYVYIPLGGNRKGAIRTYINIFIVFFICGFWHGAGVLFILWGIVHGIAMIINRLWKSLNINMPILLARFLTFTFISLSWILFRAENFTTAKLLYKSAFCCYGFAIPKIYGSMIEFSPKISSIEGYETFLLFFIPLLIAIIYINSIHKLKYDFKPNKTFANIILILFVISILVIINPDCSSEFIYFNF